MRSIGDAIVPIVVQPERLVILAPHLPIFRLSIGVLVHRRLALDERSVAEPRVTPAGRLEIELVLLDLSFWCAEEGTENLYTFTGRDLYAYRVSQRRRTVKAARKSQ